VIKNKLVSALRLTGWIFLPIFALAIVANPVSAQKQERIDYPTEYSDRHGGGESRPAPAPAPAPPPSPPKQVQNNPPQEEEEESEEKDSDDRTIQDDRKTTPPGRLKTTDGDKTGASSTESSTKPTSPPNTQPIKPPVPAPGSVKSSVDRTPEQVQKTRAANDRAKTLTADEIKELAKDADAVLGIAKDLDEDGFRIWLRRGTWVRWPLI